MMLETLPRITDHLDRFTPLARLGSSVTTQLELFLALRRAVLTEKWQEVYDLSTQCLGIGYGTYRVLQGETSLISRQKYTHDEAAKGLGNLLRTLAQTEQRHEALAVIIQRMQEKYPNGIPADIEESLQKLQSGESKEVPILKKTSQEKFPTVNIYPQREIDTAIALMLNGLLALVHANYNLAFQDIVARTEGPIDLGIEEAFQTAVNTVSTKLRTAQIQLYASLLSEEAVHEGRRAAEALATFIEQDLPRFAAVQAQIYEAARRLRSQGKGGTAERFGRLAMQAGILTREALASYAASYVLGNELLSPVKRKQISLAFEKVSNLPFDTNLPRGKRTEMKELGDAAEGDYVAIEGFITALQVIRTRDGKLVSRVELIDASSKARGYAVAVYTHLPHIGLTKGTYCRLTGTYRSEAVPFNDHPYVEIDRLPMAQLSEKSWRIAFLRSAGKWFRIWPNGVYLSWSLGPQRRARTGEETDYFGAGELIYSPLVRK